MSTVRSNLFSSLLREQFLQGCFDSFSAVNHAYFGFVALFDQFLAFCTIYVRFLKMVSDFIVCAAHLSDSFIAHPAYDANGLCKNIDDE
jgi:hypothetical protein